MRPWEEYEQTSVFQNADNDSKIGMMSEWFKQSYGTTSTYQGADADAKMGMFKEWVGQQQERWANKPYEGEKQSNWMGALKLGVSDAVCNVANMPMRIAGGIIPGEGWPEQQVQGVNDLADTWQKESPDVQEFQGSVAEGSQNFFPQALAAAPNTGVGLALSAIPYAGPIAAASFFFQLNKDEIREMALAKGADPERAETISNLGGGLNSLFEMTGLGFIAKTFKPANSIARTLLGLVLSGGGEYGTEGAQRINAGIASEWAAKPKDETVKQFATRIEAKLPEILKAAHFEGKVGAVLGLGGGVAGTAYGAATKKEAPVLTPEQEVIAYDQLKKGYESGLPLEKIKKLKDIPKNKSAIPVIDKFVKDVETAKKTIPENRGIAPEKVIPETPIIKAEPTIVEPEAPIVEAETPVAEAKELTLAERNQKEIDGKLSDADAYVAERPTRVVQDLSQGLSQGQKNLRGIEEVPDKEQKGTPEQEIAEEVPGKEPEKLSQGQKNLRGVKETAEETKLTTETTPELATETGQKQDILTEQGKPFLSMGQAKVGLKRNKVEKTHEIVDVDGGLALRKRVVPAVESGNTEETWESPDTLPDNFVYDEKSKHEADVHSNPGKITVGPKFFKLTHEQKKGVVAHEVGHELSDKMLKDGTAFDLADDGAFGPKAKDGTIIGINGQTTPGENVAEAISVLQTEPKWLKENYPKAYDAIAKRLISEGTPVPSEVLSDYPELSKTTTPDTPTTPPDATGDTISDGDIVTPVPKDSVGVSGEADADVSADISEAEDVKEDGAGEDTDTPSVDENIPPDKTTRGERFPDSYVDTVLKNKPLQDFVDRQIDGFSEILVSTDIGEKLTKKQTTDLMVEMMQMGAENGDPALFQDSHTGQPEHFIKQAWENINARKPGAKPKKKTEPKKPKQDLSKAEITTKAVDESGNTLEITENAQEALDRIEQQREDLLTMKECL